MHAPPDPEMRRAAPPGGPVAHEERLNTAESNSAITELQGSSCDEREFTLAILRLVSVRLGLIRDTIHDIGIALKNDRLTPAYARALADEAAPGCFDACAEDFQ